MHKILISACQLGEGVRHNGAHKLIEHPVFRRWQSEGRLVGICPEVAGGLPVPRPAAEIEGGQDGSAVLARHAKVRTQGGDDVSAAFIAGAERALALAVRHGCRIAVLKERSPSCGSSFVYDGRFAGSVQQGAGVTAALLRAKGVLVFSEDQLDAADAALQALASP
ncbi:DUF523 domain-containing protein [Ahniella affigens]|uniref:DUF523 domain-containing protein n=1 Tax=Ahniella affigens TaxID=2021234 RepID=A0A2P1PWF1_9GAMM|nr:DUF523 domain-containing protein [Ahniella affigens]AVP99178.1 DUF523 domain-containing protein [Ahniella affigens]